MADKLQVVTPHLVVNDASAALEFYKKALGATEVMRMPAEDKKRLLHSEIQVDGARIFVMDSFPEFRAKHGMSHWKTPQELGGTPVAIHLEVADCDAAAKRWADAGGKITTRPWDAFWGARYAQALDPFGHAWSFAHPLPPKKG